MANQRAPQDRRGKAEGDRDVRAERTLSALARDVSELRHTAGRVTRFTTPENAPVP